MRPHSVRLSSAPLTAATKGFTYYYTVNTKKKIEVTNVTKTVKFNQIEIMRVITFADFAQQAAHNSLQVKSCNVHTHRFVNGLLYHSPFWIFEIFLIMQRNFRS